MSTVQQSPPSWHGEDVTIADVLDALSQIRSQLARAEVGDGEHLHPRNCVMTLISVAPTERHEEVAKRTTQTIAMEHPAQAIVIREQPPVANRRLDAWITREDRRPICGFECELITLHVFGQAADHLAPLVDPLLVSGVPTYLWWLGTPPFGKPDIVDALRICDGLVVDSAQFAEPYRSFQRLSGMLKVAHHRMGLADFQWSRLRPWRETIAQFFAPVERRPFLNGISELGVDYAGEGRGNRIGAALLTGWFASALGWKLRRATAGAGGVVVAMYDAGGRSVEVDFRSVAQTGRAEGEVNAIRIAGSAHGTTFRLTVMHDPPRRQTPASAAQDWERRRGNTGRVLLTLIEIGEHEPLRHVQQLEAEDDAALLLDLLSTGTHDEVFNRSLAAAAELTGKF
ncbi:MAG TPA: glucose-6-phosphate dehydrogenase assembly protein OpcA [Candidatus Limnocylindrales bacterium]|nr:glucose-6-phosphate dehydrogenase assembly protein OpcA [Candidatus Limnocylindrales bacterium]